MQRETKFGVNITETNVTEKVNCRCCRLMEEIKALLYEEKLHHEEVSSAYLNYPGQAQSANFSYIS